MTEVQPLQHQMMGYDRAITMFSPDGRLLQVEYAKKTVRQGSTTIGMICSDGVLLVADKRIVDSLIVTESVEKIWQIPHLSFVWLSCLSCLIFYFLLLSLSFPSLSLSFSLSLSSLVCLLSFSSLLFSQFSTPLITTIILISII